MFVSFLFLLLILGAFSGFLAGLLGVGGGLVLVPGLYFMFQALGYDGPYLMHVCVGSSLAVIVFNGASSAYAHAKKSSVDFALALKIAPSIVVGAFAAGLIAGFVDSGMLSLIFACIILILAVIMLIDPYKISWLRLAFAKGFHPLFGLVNGFLSALAGIGGGTLSVPYLRSGGLEMSRAVGTAALLGVAIAFPGAFGFVISGLGEAEKPPFSLGFVNVLAFGVLASMSIVFAPLGVRVSHLIDPELLRRIFAGFLVVVAIKFWMDII